MQAKPDQTPQEVREVKAIGKYLRVAADKTRIMARTVVNQTVETAINTLTFAPNKSAALILKVLKSAVANAVENNHIEAEELYVKSVFVDRASSMKRFQPCAHGRAKPILKRASHITVVVKRL